MLLFHVDDQRFTCSCDHIAEILPAVPLKKMTQGQSGVCGILNYNGELVPVVDFTELLVNRPSAPFLATRLIIFRREMKRGEERTLGMVAERVTDTMKGEVSRFTISGVSLEDTPFLGGVLNDTNGLVQLVLVDGIFDVVNHLFDKD